MQLNGKIALITGSGSGIGRAIALAFAAEGASVVLNDLNLDKARESARLCSDAGCKQSLCLEGDVGSETTWVNFERTIRKDCHGQLDILVNNAAYLAYAPVLDTSEAEWDHHMTVSLKSLFWSAQYCLPLFIARGRGVIINVSSIHAHLGFKGSCAYDVCKAGMLAFTRSLAIDYAVHRIRVNAISPGVVMTEQNIARHHDPEWQEHMAELSLLKRIGLPEDIAAAAVFLASDGASFITGSELIVDGGYTTFKS